MAEFTAIHNHIIFQFEEGSVQHMGVNQFEEGTDWGFKFVSVDDSTSSARWGIITVVGPDCDNDLQPGMRILIEQLKWSEGFMVGDEKYWRTDDSVVLGIDAELVV